MRKEIRILDFVAKNEDLIQDVRLIEEREDGIVTTYNGPLKDTPYYLMKNKAYSITIDAYGELSAQYHQQ